MKKDLLIISVTLLACVSINAQQTAFINVNVVDVERGVINPSLNVLVKQNRIVYIGKRKPFPENTIQINAKGKFLIPGLVDFNAGVLEYEYAGEPALDLMLAHGVTTVRNLQPTMDAAFGRKIKSDLESGQRLGPRIYLVSPLITYKGRREKKLVVQTVPEAISAIDSVVAAGADLIKLDNTLLPDVLRAVVDRAHYHGKPVIGGWTTPFTEAAEAGVDAIDHVSDLRRTTTVNREKYFAFYRGDSSRLVSRQEFYNRVLPSLGEIDSVYFRNTVSILKQHNTWLCLNMAYMPNTIRFELGDSSRNSYRSNRMKNALQREKTEIEKLEGLERYKERVDMKEVKWAHDLGLKLIFGTQLYNFQTPGVTVHDGFYWMQENGFTPAEILRTATINPAIFMNKQGELGTVALGKLADLVLLDDNPLANINNTRKIHAVMINGRILTRRQLDEMLKEVFRQMRK